MSAGYNPEFDPTGIEGGADTNAMPWIQLPHASGLSIKPLRASRESGMFSLIVRLEKDARLENLVYLGAMDMMLLSGSMSYDDSPLSGNLEPGIWGYIPANARVRGLTSHEPTEFLANFYGPVAFLEADSNAVAKILTAFDIERIARDNEIVLVPNTLAECMQPRPVTNPGKAEPLAIAGTDSSTLVEHVKGSIAEATLQHPHFVDTRVVPWIVNPGLPDIALKILRVSEETGVTSLIVRHNGVAGPHYHLGAADFLILSGHIGYRAGPPEGYGPGVWFFEPAGARHEATQRIGEEDLIYTANVYGPVQFDEGRGTPIAAIQSWMQYKELADASDMKLVRNTFEGDTSLLAWTPVGTSAG